MKKILRIVALFTIYTKLHIIIAQTVFTQAGVFGVTGSINGNLYNSTFNNPHGIECDNFGNIYVADRYNHLIRKIDKNGIVSTLAGNGIPGSNDGPGIQASFREPWGLTVDSIGNIYVADTKNNKIRKINPSGYVTTLAGTGNFGITDSNNPLLASFGNPSGVALDKKGNIYVADHLTHLIRKISQNGAVSTFAGNRSYPNNNGFLDGLIQNAKFYRPYGIETDKWGNLYVADEWNHAIRKISTTGYVTTIAGNGKSGFSNGIGSLATFNYPWDVTLDNSGNIYVADGYNHIIRRINSSGEVVTFAGTPQKTGCTNGPALTSTFNGVTSISITSDNNTLLMADAYNQLIRRIELFTNWDSPIISFSTNTNDDTTICSGSTLKLTILGNFNYYYLIIDNVTNSLQNSPAIILDNLSIGNHQIYIKSIFPDSSQKFSNILLVKVLPYSQFQLIEIPTKPHCVSDTVILKTSDNSIVNWNTGETSSYLKINNSDIFYVKSAIGQCLSKTDTVAITFYPLPDPKLLVNTPPPYFEGDSILLIASGGTNYLWCNQASTASITVASTGTYYFVAVSEYNCRNYSDSIQIFFNPFPYHLYVLMKGQNNFCPGDSTILSTDNGFPVKWYKNGVYTGRSDTFLIVKSTGEYFFEFMLNNGKTYRSETISLLKYPLIEADYTFEIIHTNNNENTVLKLYTTNSELKIIGWEINSEYISNNPIVNVPILQSGIYDVILITETKEGCLSKTSKSIPIEIKNKEFIPNCFSPNNDNNNDVFTIHGFSGYEKLEMSIFNEWGELVFKSTNNNIHWDGIYKNKLANVGNYTYILESQKNGKNEIFSGIVTIIR